MHVRLRPATVKRHRRSRLSWTSNDRLGHIEHLESRALMAIHNGSDGDLPVAAALSDSSAPVSANLLAAPTIVNNDLIAGAGNTATAKDPQSKVWQHGSEWWSMIAINGGTYAYKLEGTTWVQKLTINATAAYTADVKPVGNGDLVYVFLYTGTNSRLAKLDYNATTSNYVLTPINSATQILGRIPIGAGSDTASMDIDSTGRMWVAYDTGNTIEVRYADAPYKDTDWTAHAPIKLADTNAAQSDLSAIIAFDHKIGVFWSNIGATTTGVGGEAGNGSFGFAYHVDGTDPTTFVAGAQPPTSTVPNFGVGIGDDHMNIKAGSDGTIYIAAKTGYDKHTLANPEMVLLIRRPNGTWDPVYGIDGTGTRPIVELDETAGFLRYIYAGTTGVSDIIYKDIPLTDIDPTEPSKFYSGNLTAGVPYPASYPRHTLIGGGATKNPSSTKQSFHGELVVLATTDANTDLANGPLTYTISSVHTFDGTQPNNLPPVNTVPGKQTFLEDAVATALSTAISIADVDAGTNNVQVKLNVTGGIVTIGSANITLTDDGNGHLTAIGTIANLNIALAALKFKPNADLQGAAAASIQVVTDDLGHTGLGGNKTDTDTITIDLTSVNDKPAFTKGGNQVVAEDAGTQSLAWATGISAGPANEAGQTLTFHITTDKDLLFATLPTIAADGTLSYQSAPNAYGSATVSVYVSDSGGTANGGSDVSAVQTFTITITPVNDVPTFTKGADQAVLQNAGAQTVAWTNAISGGAANEEGQVLTFHVSTDNDALFTVLPAIAADGTLTYTPAGILGSAIVSVYLTDDGGLPGVDTSPVQTFKITVAEYNDPPSFTKGTDQTVLEDAGAQAISWATAISPGPADESSQIVTFHVSTNNDALFAVLPSIAADGTLSYTPAANANGTATVSVYVTDDGGLPGIDTSPTQTFKINVTPVNDAPSFVAGPDQSVYQDGSGSYEIPGWATQISPGPADEVGQALHFEVQLSGDAGVLSGTPTISADGKLAFAISNSSSGVVTVLVTLVDGGGSSNGGSDRSGPTAFTITVLDPSVNDGPAIFETVTPATLEDTPLAYAGFSVSDSDDDTLSMKIDLVDGTATIGTNNLTVVGNGTSHISVTGPKADLNAALALFVFTPAPDAHDSSSISITVDDLGHGGTVPSRIAVGSAPIIVTSVNDAPTITLAADQNIAEDAGAQTVAGFATGISAGPANESAQVLTLVVTNDNNSLFEVQPTIGFDGKLTYKAAADAHGTATVTVTLSDDGGTSNGGVDTTVKTFKITVGAVNDAPSFVAGGDQAVLENAGLQTVAAFATAISAGPADEVGQILTFHVSTNNNALFAVLPAIALDGTLTYTPATDASGAAIVSVYLTDDGGLPGVDTSPTKTFNINVGAVNAAPAFTKGLDETVLEDSTPHAVAGWATGISAGPASESTQTLTFTVTNDNNALFSVQPAIAADGKLTYTLAANANGTAIVTVTLKDSGGTANGGVDTSAPQAFNINVTAVNDVPAFTKGLDVNVAQDSPAQTLAGWATGLSLGPLDEALQTLSFAVTNNNNALFSVQPSILPNGTLSFTPAAGAAGTATVTVTAKDSGGIDNGGVDTSAPQTFLISVAPLVAPTGVFAKSAGQKASHPDDEGRSIVVDANGFSYVTGTLHYTDTKYENIRAKSADIFVDAYKPDGTLLWHKEIASANDERATAIARDSQGNLYITGNFAGTVDFDPATGTGHLVNKKASSGSDLFVLKLNSLGAFQWVNTYAGSGTELGYSIAVDASNNVLVAGQFDKTLTLAPSAVFKAAKNQSAFVLKLNSNGAFQWADEFDTATKLPGLALTTDAAGHVFLTGSYKGTVDFNPGLASSAKFNLTSVSGTEDAFVLRLESNGTFGWAKSLGGRGEDQGQAITVDTAGNVYTTGHFSKDGDFDPSGGTAKLTAKKTDVFVSKLTSTGAFAFAKQITGAGDAQGRGIAVLSDNSVALAGWFDKTMDLVHGSATGVTSTGKTDVFVAHLSAAGVVLNSQTFGGTKYDQGRALAVDSHDDLYVTGGYSKVMKVDTGAGVVTLTPLKGSDIFIVKLHSTLAPSVGTTIVAPPPALPIHAASLDVNGAANLAFGLAASQSPATPAPALAADSVYADWSTDHDDATASLGDTHCNAAAASAWEWLSEAHEADAEELTATLKG